MRTVGRARREEAKGGRGVTTKRAEESRSGAGTRAHESKIRLCACLHSAATSDCEDNAGGMPRVSGKRNHREMIYS